MDWHTLKTRLLSFLNLSKGCTASEIQISTGCHGNQNLKLDFLANYNVFGIIIFPQGHISRVPPSQIQLEREKYDIT